MQVHTSSARPSRDENTNKTTKQERYRGTYIRQAPREGAAVWRKKKSHASSPMKSSPPKTDDIIRTLPILHTMADWPALPSRPTYVTLYLLTRYILKGIPNSMWRCLPVAHNYDRQSPKQVQLTRNRHPTFFQFAHFHLCYAPGIMASASSSDSKSKLDDLETAKWTKYLPEAFGIREGVRQSSYRWCVREGYVI